MNQSIPEPPLVVIGGPTACGKSGLALTIAETFNGTIINADSMQLYRDLRVLTARPDDESLARAPHKLYGILDAATVGSAAWWLPTARAAVAQTHAEGRLPIVVGGTGLYLGALLHGLAPIAEVPAPVRAEARAMMAALGPEAVHRQLAERDPIMAARLRPTDPQRLTRAWEVLMASGRSLASWQEEPPVGRVQARTLALVLMPPRETLYNTCNHRLEAMIIGGALEEVRHLQSRQLPPEFPIMKSLGLSALTQHLDGEITLADAITLAQAATRHYAKRQCTWFRHRLPEAITLSAPFSESLLPELLSIIRPFLLTKTD